MGQVIQASRDSDRLLTEAVSVENTILLGLPNAWRKKYCNRSTAQSIYAYVGD